MTTVEELHEAHGDVAHLRPNVATEELHELVLYLQDNGWSGVLCLREAVEAMSRDAAEMGVGWDE